MYESIRHGIEAGIQGFASMDVKGWTISILIAGLLFVWAILKLERALDTLTGIDVFHADLEKLKNYRRDLFGSGSGTFDKEAQNTICGIRNFESTNGADLRNRI